jgi:2-polyprenyl-6-methoxyphenol hydroxylase-like FAD-dependent oxidoreductase
MPKPMRDPILIVGAGPTGLALACDLYRRGVPCRVVEAARERGTRSKAIAIWPRVLEILDDLGVAQSAVQRGVQLHGSTVWSGGRPALSFRLDALPSRFPFGLVLPQYETEALLERRLGELGGKVERGVRCIGVRQGARAAEAVVRLAHASGIEEAAAAWVVGCDGAASAVRESVGIRMRQRLEPEGWIAADVRLATPLEPTGVNYFLGGGQVLHVVPLLDRGADGMLWRITMNVGRVRPDPAEWPLDRLAEQAARRAAVALRVTAAEWVTGFRVKQGLAARFRDGRVLIAGDAAHVHSPAGAQGINAGLQDAANLGWKLARVALGQAGESLLSSYDTERRPAARAMVRSTDRATRAGTLRPAPAVAARDALWQFAQRRNLIERRVVPALAGLSARQPRSALVAAPRLRRPGAALVAGQRLPNVVVGEHTLWDLLAPLDYTILLLGRQAPDAGEATLLPAGIRIVADRGVDNGNGSGTHVEDRLAAALGVRGAALLVVRPDRYIALRGPANRLERAARVIPSDRQEK